MNMPSFSAEASLYQTRGRYQVSGQGSNLQTDAIVPAIPACRNCDYILDNCANNGWRPRAVCNACNSGRCYEEPPPPDPYGDPFGPLPRF